MKRKSIPACIAIGTALVGIAAPAFAEGSKSTYMFGWLTGLETSAWDDNNRDNVGTKFAAKDCSYDTRQPVKNITMELNRNDTWTPDEHYGDKTLVCTPTSALHTVNWGDKGAGNFDMTLKKIDGQVTSTKGKLNADTVKISW